MTPRHETAIEFCHADSDAKSRSLSLRSFAALRLCVRSGTPRERYPRLSSTVVVICILAALPGCAFKEWIVRKTTSPPPRALMSDATPDEILEHLNNQRSQVVAWRSTDVRIKASGTGVIAPSLSANISVESPKNLRFSARSIRGTEVDFGSNSDRFWFWMRANEPDIVLTGSHDGLDRQQAVPIPFPPGWLMEALGVIPIDPLAVQVLRDPETPDRAKLISADYVQGQQVQRVMVVDLALGQIIEHSLYDANDKLITSAAMSNFQPSAGIMLPRTIALNCPEAGSRMTMTIGDIEVNPSIPVATWQMQLDPNLRQVDLDRIQGDLPVRQ
ncbi:MAG: hypothetical protein ACKVHE_09560 [Planctomycetales bacterium]